MMEYPPVEAFCFFSSCTPLDIAARWLLLHAASKSRLFQERIAYLGKSSEVGARTSVSRVAFKSSPAAMTWSIDRRHKHVKIMWHQRDI